MKICNTCRIEKPLIEFGKHSTSADGYNPKCKSCVSEYQKKYRKKHKEKLRQYQGEYTKTHRNAARERVHQWRKDNPERKREYDRNRYSQMKEVYSEQARHRHLRNREANCTRSRKWREENKDRVVLQIAKRRCAKKQAIPTWVDFDLIESFYSQAALLTEQTGIPHQVDHIVPLTSKVVCGLHCADNLRVVTAEENNSKNNKLLEELL